MPEATRGWSADIDRDDLREDRLPADPFALFTEWLEAARAADLIEPTAMTLATADAEGRPSARTVLLKGFDADGFRFYTNYESRKAYQLAENPRAALVFWWDKLERQVRIEGQVDKLPTDESDRYFARRPRGSQIGAHASVQSSRVPDRATLERRFADTEARFADREIPRPANWGGYRLAPATIEFWQGRANRMHDRIQYRREDGAWQRERLSP